jgi:ribonuclease HII
MPSFRAELGFHRQGCLRVAGLDEVGRGSWAGPLVAGAVILPVPTRGLRRRLSAVNDSKLLTPEQREECADLIRQHAIAFAIGCVSVAELDQRGLTRATHLAMHRAIDALVVQPQALLLDAFPLPAATWPQRAIVRGDSFSYSIAAASIIAKTARDAMMRELGASFPQYGFEKHKGYGTEVHQRALREFGLSPAHRRTWAPIRALSMGRSPG